MNFLRRIRKRFPKVKEEIRIIEIDRGNGLTQLVVKRRRKMGWKITTRMIAVIAAFQLLGLIDVTGSARAWALAVGIIGVAYLAICTIADLRPRRRDV